MRAFEITTTELCLTPLGSKHITTEYLGWLQDPQLMKFSQQKSRVHTLASCRAYAQNFDHQTRCLWAIETTAGSHIGNINAYLTPEHQLADIGILIGSKAAGRGWGTQAWQGVMQCLFQSYGARKVTGGCLSTHEAMIAIMTRVGMMDDGRRTGHYLHEGEAIDVVHMGMFADKFTPAPRIAIDSAPVPDWSTA